MQKPEQGASGNELCDYAEVGRLGASSHEQHHVWMLQALHDAHFSPELLYTKAAGAQQHKSECCYKRDSSNGKHAPLSMTEAAE